VHTSLAFTTWLDFNIALKQARKIKNELAEILPEKAGELEKNFARLETELLSLHNQLKGMSLDEVIIGSHPVYQYLSAAYQLNIHSVHFEPNEMPSSKQWHELEHLLEHHSSALMIWENEPIDEIKAELTKRKISVVVFNPCGNKPGQGDFLSVMTQNVKILTSIQATD
jgi:zinc transport system substrate-binding protein